MHRAPLIALAIAASFVVKADGIGAQPGPVERRPLGTGIDVAGTGMETWAGPTIGARVGGIGPLDVLADVSLQWRVHATRIANTNVADGGAPVTRDSRPLHSLGTATIALEGGTRDRIARGGLFAAVRAGGGAGRWGSGDVHYELQPGRRFAYRERGYTAGVLTAGAEIGMWLPAFQRANRLSLRFEAVEARLSSSRRVAFVVLSQ